VEFVDFFVFEADPRFVFGRAAFRFGSSFGFMVS
jgi:hypothetical protein